MRGFSRFSQAHVSLVLIAVISWVLLASPSGSAAHKPSDPKNKNAANKLSEIAPRRPNLPAAKPGSPLTNPIDLLLQPYFEQHKFSPPSVVSDRVYARRVYLDLIGLLPTPTQLASFEADKSPDKRAKLVDQLLANNEAYAIHWLSFWNDALRNDYRGTGYIDGGRKQITTWLYNALLKNIPYDQFVRELISPVPESEGFVKGIVWRGVVNASQVPPVQAAQNIGQVFMGINLKCASCHDSFINTWKLTDAYGLAGVFSEQPLEIHHCDAPTKKFAAQKFLYKELGDIDEKAPRAERMKQLAAIITNPQNGQLTRTMVNRLWARFLGHGIIDPVDEMEDDPWNRDLLDWLAVDFSDHHYDLKHTMKQIVTSRAYQLPSVGVDEQEKDYVFKGPSVKRMSAEQFMDAFAQVAGPWKVVDASGLKYPTPPGEKGKPKPAPISALTLPWQPGENPLRIALTTADPLQLALGRTNREQVVTSRPQAATTLEALELTNGGELAKQLARGADRWLERSKNSSSDMIPQLYLLSLGRPPTAEELQLAQQLVGSPLQKQGIEDLLWVLLMLPEFQLIL